ncbi:MAG TPA: aromatic ring-hydroxylating dioxygenase subunit alpha, partial [Ktedonobacterales bacterium]
MTMLDISGDALDEQLRQGKTLPAAWYTSDAVSEAERQRIYRRTWQYAGLLEDLAKPGDFLTCTLGEAPVIVVRGNDGELRAFANVCRHRGSVIVGEACGHKTSLQCPYHAWTYRLDGTLLAAPGMKQEEGFDPERFSLPALPIETWGPFVFVSPDPQAPPLASVLGELPALLAATGLDLGGLRRRTRRTYDIAANWKVVLDNYLECYHCPVAHKGFTDLIDLENYTVTEYEQFSTQTGPVKNATGLYDTSGGVTAGFYAYVWPNFTINVYPGPGNVSLNLFLPVGAHRTIATYEYLFTPAVSQAEEEEFTRFIDQVQEEDVVLCE